MLLSSLALAATLTATPTTQLPERELPEAGHFGGGFNLEPLSLGSAQAFSAGGSAAGLNLQGALQFDLGPRWALRMPVDLSAGGSSAMSYGELGITPGLLYRWRDSEDQTWVPYVGGGLRLGLVGAGRGLVGLPPVTAQRRPVAALGFDSDDWDSDSDSDLDLEMIGRVAPEVWVGIEWHASRWFALNLGGAYMYTRILGTGVHVLHERVGIRISL